MFNTFLKTSNATALEILFSTILLCSLIYSINSVTVLDSGTLKGNNRSSKWLPIFVLIGNDQCNSTDSHEVGTCFTTAQCKRAGGLPKGKCASGFGVCCVTVATCFDTITKNNTYFRSKGFPDVFRPKEHQVCTTKIKKPSKDICQVLLTLNDMELAHGNANGLCLLDNIQIFGTNNYKLPHLCGKLSHQHLYLEFGHTDLFMKLSISTDGFQDDTLGRKWNIQVTFIKCNDPFRAPSGCLQYFTKSRGTVRMLGYPGIPHLGGLHYTICVRKELGAESIFWFPCRDVPIEKAFHTEGPSVLVSGLTIHWRQCNGDYIIIMSDFNTSTATPDEPRDRYCGNRLTVQPPFYVNSKVTPYIVGVRTDLSEGDNVGFDQDNVGFCLEWMQVIFQLDEDSDGMIMPPDALPPPGPFRSQTKLNRLNSKLYKWKPLKNLI